MDRNIFQGAFVFFWYKSLSARRAWIEMIICCEVVTPILVALRKESVDRNRYGYCSKWQGGIVALRKESVDRNSRNVGIAPATPPSLSARRAWIEMDSLAATALLAAVALRKESVDRNCNLVCIQRIAFCRSPQGERG